MRKIVLAIIVLCFVSNGVWGQSYATFTTNKDTITIGDPFMVALTISIKSDDKPLLDFSDFLTPPNLLYEQDTVNFSPYADYSILDGGKIGLTDKMQTVSTQDLAFSTEGNTHLYHDSIRLTIFDVGVFSLPNPQPVNASQDWINTEAPIITVLLPDEIQKALQDSAGVAPIKPIIEEPLALEDFKYGFLIIGLILLFTLLFYFLRKRRKKESLATKEPEIVLPAHVIALEKLDQLKKKELWQKGEIKAYQSELTYIVREYLGNRYGINALEMTTDEILRTTPTEINRNDLQQILQIADMVKFAKANPPQDLHSRFMEMAYKLIENTKEEIITTEND